MASNQIIIKAELRPCYVKGKRALFHKWVERSELINGNILKDTFAIVEFEDGKVREAYITDIRFADGGEFGQIFFPETMLDRSRKEAGGNAADRCGCV